LNRKELNPEQSPIAAFGARLRSKREERGWTQEELAPRVGYGSSHVSAVETARKPPTFRFAQSADRVFGGHEFEALWRDLKHGSLLEGFPQYVGYEPRAVEIRLYEIGVIPGLLQTPEYARVLADSAVRRGAIPPEHAVERVAFLAERQASLEQPRPPMMHVVMDESCIRRKVGGPDVMNAQLERLVEFAGEPNTMLQIAPFDIGERRAFHLPVNLLTLPDRSVILYAESQTRGHLDRKPTSVLPMLRAYHQLQAEALSQTQSVALIQQARKGTP
jgi:transcriptional regulator with XRE-family HTH domain